MQTGSDDRKLKSTLGRYCIILCYFNLHFLKLLALFFFDAIQILKYGSNSDQSAPAENGPSVDGPSAFKGFQISKVGVQYGGIKVLFTFSLHKDSWQ